MYMEFFSQILCEIDKTVSSYYLENVHVQKIWNMIAIKCVP